MNLPNKLTVLRIILVPFFVAFLLIDDIAYNYLWALIIFALASITDCMDGYIARKHNLVTNLGKFLDPLADKVLVLSAMIVFIELGLSSSVVVIVVIAREFLVTSLRLVAASDGTVISASIYGKIKTIVQMVAIVLILLLKAISQFVDLSIDIDFLSNVLMWITAFFAIVSGVDYLWKNRSCVNTTK